MGLFDWFRKLYSVDKKLKLLILGLDNAGKTSCLKRFSDEQIDHIMPTQGFNIKTLTSNNIKVTLWDMGGQKSIRPYWQNEFDNVDTLIYVIDSSDKRRLEESGIQLLKLLKNNKLNKVPLLILANKQDLNNILSIQDISQKLLLNTIRDRNWTIQPCSAKTGKGLKSALLWAINNNEKIKNTKSNNKKK